MFFMHSRLCFTCLLYFSFLKHFQTLQFVLPLHPVEMLIEIICSQIKIVVLNFTNSFQLFLFSILLYLVTSRYIIFFNSKDMSR